MMHQFSPKFVQDAATVRLRAFILPGVGGSRNRDAVEVALDRGFVEGVTRSADSEVMHDPGIAVGWDVLHY